MAHVDHDEPRFGGNQALELGGVDIDDPAVDLFEVGESVEGFVAVGGRAGGEREQRREKQVAEGKLSHGVDCISFTGFCQLSAGNGNSGRRKSGGAGAGRAKVATIERHYPLKSAP